ncbi:hypothetical protein PGT21_002767 [Puccinia graminis f. sp. tritici]|uniref:Zn(2)-C6 fungal-type domain-containing protein n=1 Tax=Puccinia graminis f. sp. tritici TaxID=56615 RepID=A0A5B0NDC2_PUCGR|nr:hypothetical protein PGT21_002767 [Puccinia graminis f. sp. tritici]
MSNFNPLYQHPSTQFSFPTRPQPHLEHNHNNHHHPNSNHHSNNHDHSHNHNHNLNQTAIHSKPFINQPQPWSPISTSTTTTNISPPPSSLTNTKQKLPPAPLILTKPSPSSSASPSSSSSTENFALTTKPKQTPLTAASTLEAQSAHQWNQSSNRSTHLKRNNIPSAVTIQSSASSSTTNLKSNLDQFKNHHHHPDDDLVLADHPTTTPTTSKPIDEDSSFHHLAHSSASPLSAPIIPDTHHPTNQPNHIQSENIHLQFTPSSGFQKDNKVLKDVKRRTTKACDNCRKSKCKCTRAPDANGVIPTAGPCQNCVTNGVECTFNGTSRKRGPPKGYIEAIESRLHRMEALLGGLLENDDPRAQALFSELIGDNEVRELLTSDLKIAAQQGTEGKPRKSWKPPDSIIATNSSSDRRKQLNLTDTQKVLWGVNRLTQTFDFKDHRSQESSQPNGQSPDIDDDSECEDSQLDHSPPPPPNDDTNLQHKNRRRRLESNVSSNHRSKSQVTTFNQPSSTTTIPHTGTATFTLSRSELSTLGTNKSQFTFECNKSLRPPNSDLSSTKQHSPATISELADVVGQLSLDENDEVRYHGRSSGLYLISASQRYKDFFWHFPKPGFWPVAPIRRSPTSSYILELVNPLELLPSQQTMNHLLDLYWEFVHPMMPILYKPEFMAQFQNLMANLDTVKRARPHWSLNQIWCHAMCKNVSSTDESSSDPSEHQSPPSIYQPDQQTEPPVSGLGPTNRISILLLLVMFSISARYSDQSSSAPTEGQYWNAGDNYLEKAKQMLNLDYGNSKLTNCQSLILMAYREIGAGAMAESWLYTGMAIRMAQDMGLFRDVDKWFMPVKKFTYEDKQIRKRVWWACVNMDKYVSTYIGRPMMIFERDYDTAFPSTDEPDEHEPWSGCMPKKSLMDLPPANLNYRNAVQDRQVNELAEVEVADPIAVEELSSRADCPSQDPNVTAEQKIHTVSCFNRAASLSVLISRIVANIYAIRIRVIGQSSETLLSLLDQNLARWYLDLPEQLHYKPQSIPSRPTKAGGKSHESNKRAPTPHLLTLHAQFYTALILLHRPFIPASRSQDTLGNNPTDSPPAHPSHSICTTAANAITNIAQAYHEAFGLRKAPAFLVYYIFTAAILHVNNARLEAGLALAAKSNLLKCMNSLKEMAPTWTGAVRAWELLSGLVDLRDVDFLEYKQQPSSHDPPQFDTGQPKKAISADRGLKRPASSSDLEHHLLNSRADQKHLHSFSSKSTLGNNKLHSTTASTAHQNSRWGLGKPMTPFRNGAPHVNMKPVRSISTSDWCSMGMDASKKIGEISENPSAREQAPNPTPQAQPAVRSPDEMGMGIYPEKSSGCKIGPSEFSITAGNPTVLSPTTGANNSMVDSNNRPPRDLLQGEGDRQCLHGPPALPTTAMEEMIGFWGSNRNMQQPYPQTPSHQTLQQQQPQCPSNGNQVLSPLLFDLSGFTSSPTGNPPYGSLNEYQSPTTTIQGIFGLGGSGSENLRGMNDQVLVDDQENSMVYENREDCGRVVEEGQRRRQGIGGSLSFSTEQTAEDGSFSDLGLNWFSSPVETIGGFGIDHRSRTLLTPNSRSHDSHPPPYHQHHDSISRTSCGEQAYNAVHF